MDNSPSPSDRIREKAKQYLFPAVGTYYEEPLVIERGRGATVVDAEGRQYLDFFAGILTVGVGHCHPAVTKRAADQAARLQHTSTLYLTEPAVALAERLAQITPGRLLKTYFTNSGSEANETAVLAARCYTGREEVVALRHGYSGRTALAMSLTGQAPWRLTGSGLSAGVVHAANPYCYRCPYEKTYPSCDLVCARDVEQVIQTATGGRIAAFLAEPIQGVGGFIVPPREYFQVVVEIVRRYGGVFICDEVQTGFGRTGGKMFGIQHFGVEPEVMTFAKTLGNGAPIGATIAVPEVADSLKGLTISTFGGNPVSAEAARATIEVVLSEELVHNAEVVGRRVRGRLEALKERFPLVGDVRGMGLMQALELVEDGKRPAARALGRVFEETKKRGLLIGKGGFYGNVIRLAPPLNVDPSDADAAMDILEASLEAVAG
ncbi:MAG: aspartate aminotransferase family protein [Candidatus Tectomicrobia bacterium]|nr:aspartate aminotransferase family protein [Candidatus Tectomicrobia bacterium]